MCLVLHAFQDIFFVAVVIVSMAAVVFWLMMPGKPSKSGTGLEAPIPSWKPVVKKNFTRAGEDMHGSNFGHVR